MFPFAEREVILLIFGVPVCFGVNFLFTLVDVGVPWIDELLPASTFWVDFGMTILLIVLCFRCGFLHLDTFGGVLSAGFVRSHKKAIKVINNQNLNFMAIKSHKKTELFDKSNKKS